MVLQTLGAANVVTVAPVGTAYVGVLISCMCSPGINTTVLIDVWWGRAKTECVNRMSCSSQSMLSDIASTTET